MKLPASICALTGNAPYTFDGIGKSGSAVLLYPDRVLKIQPCGETIRRQRDMMNWLRGKLPVPEVLAYREEDRQAYLLMSRCAGEMACAERYMRDPAEQTRLLARALQMLWAVDVTGCPSDCGLDRKLAEAAYNVSHGLVDVDDCQPGTFGANGFADPAALLEWLQAHRPVEESVLSHGDFCLPNVLFREGEVSGFLDLDHCGIGDRWCDIAILHRSLANNYGGRYGNSYPGYDPGLLFRELGIAPDWDKLRYYILLDELS